MGVLQILLKVYYGAFEGQVLIRSQKCGLDWTGFGIKYINEKSGPQSSPKSKF